MQFYVLILHLEFDDSSTILFSVIFRWKIQDKMRTRKSLFHSKFIYYPFLVTDFTLMVTSFCWFICMYPHFFKIYLYCFSLFQTSLRSRNYISADFLNAVVLLFSFTEMVYMCFKILCFPFELVIWCSVFALASSLFASLIKKQVELTAFVESLFFCLKCTYCFI